MVRISEVVACERPESLLGELEVPLAGAQVAGYALFVEGWAASSASRVARVRIEATGGVIASAPTEITREDVAAAFPELVRAERSGFRTGVGLIGFPPRVDLTVVAEAEDGTATPLWTFTRRAPLSRRRRGATLDASHADHLGTHRVDAAR